jgi:DNA-binding NarL/FixJ family response regulator
MRVLVLDPSQAIRSRLIGRLRELGFEVIGDCGCLADALASIAIAQPDAIISDLLFDDSRGVDVVIAMRARAPDALLVIATNDLHFRRACLANGADHFLDKSSDLDDIGATLGVLQDRPR